MKTYLAIDQYGHDLLLESKHPRKELLEYHSTSHAAKIYIDTKEGTSRHIGYVVSGYWYTLYKLTLFNGKV
jgi:hypothetical protein